MAELLERGREVDGGRRVPGARAAGRDEASDGIKGDDTLRSRSTHLTFRKFCDQVYYPCLEATVGRPYSCARPRRRPVVVKSRDGLSLNSYLTLPAGVPARGLPLVLYVHGGSDSTGAVRSVETIATGLKWKRLREPLTVIGTPDVKDREACWELGATVAASLML